MAKVAVVTGSNKGIGLQIVKDLCKQFNGDVFLTSRDNTRGQAAVHLLEKEGLHPKYHQLDISDHDSIVTLRNFLQKTYGGLDCLVNNAAILYEQELYSQICKGETPSSEVPLPEVVENTCKVNFFDTLHACEVLFPILRPHARAAQENKLAEEGFPTFAYGMSKLGMNVMTAIQQRDVDSKGGEDILINAVSPGFVATEMTQHRGTLSVEEGAETPVYVALLPPNIPEPRGKFIRNKEISQVIQGCLL